MDDITYDVRLYKTDVYKGATVTTYYVRWKTGTKSWKASQHWVALSWIAATSAQVRPRHQLLHRCEPRR